ncbi:hypothetical protein ALI144C_18420 [Actinosynnema sp. ALI-1.44]|uniref:helix-turn-helix domain-containing protein n=1 Tax=Actinosynnema sp. ALI-1.44 TaxID=1933779 RepID=UPI00097C4395|nr:helix-turn-helix transcriptional regulator [Actinosynnema sp. ALI-1.44]ONI83019.1 hypothetical protein ALI144C_18420 [Actinosynnema sp. ALI-1.44]
MTRVRNRLEDRELAGILRSGPFELALRTAVRSSGLSLDRLAYHLSARGIQVSASSLSNWQTGRSRPERPESVHAVHAIEEILGLTPDALVQLLGPRRPRGRWLGHVPGAVPHGAIFDDHDRLTRILTDAELLDRQRWSWLNIEDRVVFDSAGLMRTVEVRLTLSALVDGLDRCVIFYRTEDGNQPEVYPGDGCRLGRTRLDDDAGYLVAELLFDHALNRGDVHFLTFEQRFTRDLPRPEPGDHYYKAFRAPCRNYLMRVVFHADAVPVRMHAFQSSKWGVEPTETRPLPCQRNRVVHLYASDVRPGIVGVQWEWS